MGIPKFEDIRVPEAALCGLLDSATSYKSGFADGVLFAAKRLESLMAPANAPDLFPAPADDHEGMPRDDVGPFRAGETLVWNLEGEEIPVVVDQDAPINGWLNVSMSSGAIQRAWVPALRRPSPEERERLAKAEPAGEGR